MPIVEPRGFYYGSSNTEPGAVATGFDLRFGQPIYGPSAGENVLNMIKANRFKVMAHKRASVVYKLSKLNPVATAPGSVLVDPPRFAIVRMISLASRAVELVSGETLFPSRIFKALVDHASPLQVI